MFHFKYKDYSFWCDIGMMTPLQYIRMINLLEEYNPQRICELGSGQSTDIFETYAKKYNSNVFSIEHDLYFNTHKSNVIFTLFENVQFMNYGRCNIYNGFEEWLKSQDSFDFVLIDAPNDGIPTNNQNLKYARIQLLDFVILNKLSSKSIVMFHDSEREISQNTLLEFEKLLLNNGFHFSKEIVIEKDKEIYNYNKLILGLCPELTIYKIWDNM